jgi:hypothetical protein
MLYTTFLPHNDDMAVPINLWIYNCFKQELIQGLVGTDTLALWDKNVVSSITYKEWLTKI